MADEKTSGAVAGAAQGAAAGAAVGSVVPVIGTAIGAVVGGIVGGVAGLFGGKKRKKAKKYRNELKKLQKFVARKELLQQSQFQASDVSNVVGQVGAGTERSSGGFGVISSVASQRGDAIKQSNFSQKRTSRIAKLEEQANAIEGYISAASSITESVAGGLGKLGGGKKPPSGEPPIGSSLPPIPSNFGLNINGNSLRG